jgi:hypothetical protein
MIGKPEWFKQRKYSGWGIIPKTWQGYVYIIALLVPFVVFQALPFWSIEIRIYATIAWLAFLAFDVSHIMVTIKRDEREYKIEAMSERNAAWIMIAVLVAGILYEAITSALQQTFKVDWFLIAALFGGLIAKMISNLAYERKAL